MSFGIETSALLGGIKVYTTDGRGFTPEEIAERALDKIIYVGNKSDSVIRDQALVYKSHIKRILEFYLKEAGDCYKITLTAELERQGQPEMAALVRKI